VTEKRKRLREKRLKRKRLREHDKNISVRYHDKPQSIERYKPNYEAEESEVDYEILPEPEVISTGTEGKITENKNGNLLVRWVNTNVDNVRLGLGALIFLCSILILNNNLNIKNAYITSSQSLYNVLLMGKSTGDLTMWARQYVVTENPKYKKAYEDHLIVRSGNRADDNGIKKSYDQRFKDIPTEIVPEDDKQKLLDSLSASEFLALKETDAFGLVENGEQDKAIDVLFNKEYDLQKEKTVTPLLEFTKKLQIDVGKLVVTKLYFSYGYIILLCIANLILIFLINDRLDFKISDDD
ncbi:uncharacterized protein METZ01_LOCUS220022, partial [marine metagenome]